MKSSKEIAIEHFKPEYFEGIKLPLIVVYKNPTDYPNMYAARIWNSEKPTTFVLLKETKEEIRAEIPNGMAMLLPDSKDDKCIEEIWI